MSDIVYNGSHALCMVYLEMTAADGKIEDSEQDEVAKKVMKWKDAFKTDPKQTWKESVNWFKSFDSVESRVENVIGILKMLPDILEREGLIEVGKDLVDVAASDGEIAENEKKFFNAFLEIVGLTIDDLK
ncbi:MAG: hypothetical protein CL832_02275 [Crocinitomicaceae bacterium]|jgi:tellurite resistance protein|nr:hypothetical protein [Crocinitomicaceae bacterium]|tara:strand:+ start:1042 stop:1431 length:390 start_codon:yes stop_codon:yes gene_type:complete